MSDTGEKRRRERRPRQARLEELHALANGRSPRDLDDPPLSRSSDGALSPISQGGTATPRTVNGEPLDDTGFAAANYGRSPQELALLGELRKELGAYVERDSLSGLNALLQAGASDRDAGSPPPAMPPLEDPLRALADSASPPAGSERGGSPQLGERIGSVRGRKLAAILRQAEARLEAHPSPGFAEAAAALEAAIAEEAEASAAERAPAEAASRSPEAPASERALPRAPSSSESLLAAPPASPGAP
eukprot:tig00000241_g20945.t1